MRPGSIMVHKLPAGVQPKATLAPYQRNVAVARVYTGGSKGAAKAYPLHAAVLASLPAPFTVAVALAALSHLPAVTAPCAHWYVAILPGHNWPHPCATAAQAALCYHYTILMRLTKRGA